jgi:DNA polymerase III sliding clamp (beta) subunit (PCNA family)
MDMRTPNVTLPVYALRALLKLAPKGDFRPHYSGVHFDFANGRAAVTNGHYVLIHKFESANPVGSGMIPRASLEEALKGAGRRDRVEIYLSYATFTIECGTQTITVSSLSSFPDVMKTVPVRVTLKPAQFDSEYLAALQDALQTLSASDKFPVLARNGDGRAALLFIPNETQTLALIMPIRVENNDVAQWSEAALAAIKGTPVAATETADATQAA